MQIPVEKPLTLVVIASAVSVFWKEKNKTNIKNKKIISKEQIQGSKRSEIKRFQKKIDKLSCFGVSSSYGRKKWSTKGDINLFISFWGALQKGLEKYRTLMLIGFWGKGLNDPL